jgi:antitoxin component of RelBE/YafQ-DinJ toxin-antitoxin module
MSDPTQNIDLILNQAANNLRIPTETAQLLMVVGAELLAQRELISGLREEVEQLKIRTERELVYVNKRVDRAQGIHGT